MNAALLTLALIRKQVYELVRDVSMQRMLAPAVALRTTIWLMLTFSAEYGRVL